MTNREMLNKVREEGIDVGQVYVANEVEGSLDGRKISEKRFEILCNKAYELWLKLEEVTPRQCADAIVSAYRKNKFEDFQQMEKYELSNYIEF